MMEKLSANHQAYASKETYGVEEESNQEGPAKKIISGKQSRPKAGKE